MSPPKVAKAKAPTAATLDFTKKMRIVRASKALASVPVRQTDVYTLLYSLYLLGECCFCHFKIRCSTYIVRFL